MKVIILPTEISPDIVEWYSWNCVNGISNIQLHFLKHILAIKNGYLTEAETFLVIPKYEVAILMENIDQNFNVDIVFLPENECYILKEVLLKHCFSYMINLLPI